MAPGSSAGDCRLLRHRTGDRGWPTWQSPAREQTAPERLSARRRRARRERAPERAGLRPIVQNPSQTPLSLIRLGISLIRRFNSLLGLKKFPVLSHRELTHKGLIRHAIFCRWIWATEPKIDEIPCIFPASREFGISETSSQLTPPSSAESSANLTFG